MIVYTRERWAVFFKLRRGTERVRSTSYFRDVQRIDGGIETRVFTLRASFAIVVHSRYDVSLCVVHSRSSVSPGRGEELRGGHGYVDVVGRERHVLLARRGYASPPLKHRLAQSHAPRPGGPAQAGDVPDDVPPCS